MAKKVYGVKPKVEVTETAKTENYETIFTLVTRNNKTRIAVTNKIISVKEFDTVKAAKEYIDSKPWELIVNATLVINDITNSKK